jgi:tetratricopeptide (TPR) repeat protein
MPRYFEEVYPQSILEVIEIDPEITRIAFDYLGLSSDTHIVTYNEDARMAVPKLPEGRYDLVIGDAFNDLSVPYHLTTLEFNEQVRALLKEDGIYVVNVVDKLHSGRFLRAYVNTLQRTFPYVYLIEDDPDWEDDARKPHVVAGSFQPVSSAALNYANTQMGRGHPFGYIMPDDIIKTWLNAQTNIILTDDYAPVDNLVAPLHLGRRFGLSKAEEHYNVGVELESQGRLKEAIAEYDKALHLDPNFSLAYNNRGAAYANLGQFQRAIQDYDESLRLDLQNNVAYNNRGAAYADLGQFQQAIQDYDEAIRLNPQDAKAYFNRGNAYYDLDQLERAIQDYDEAIRLNPQDAKAYFNRGVAYKKLGRKAEAIADFERFITLTNNPQWIEMARRVFEKLSQW